MAYQVSAGSLLSMISAQGGYSVTTRKNVTTTNSSARSAREANEEFRQAVRGLRDYDPGKMTDTAMKNKLNDFVDSYNTMSTDGGEIKSSEYKKSFQKLKECVTDNIKDLKKIGISFNEKSVLEFDEDKFKTSTREQRMKIFGGRDSFIGQVQKLARDTYRKTDKQVSYTEAKDLTVSILLSEEESMQASNVYGLSNELNNMRDNRDTWLEDNETLKEGIKGYQLSYNTLMKQEKLSETYYTGMIQDLQKREDIQSSLEQLGISFDEDGLMQFDQSVIDAEGHGVTDEATVDAYDQLFSQDSSYKTLLGSYCGKAFASLVGAATSGITINEYA